MLIIAEFCQNIHDKHMKSVEVEGIVSISIYLIVLVCQEKITTFGTGKTRERMLNNEKSNEQQETSQSGRFFEFSRPKTTVSLKSLWDFWRESSKF